MFKKIAVFGCLATSSWVYAFTPQAGTWIVTGELNGAPGRGLAIDVQDNVMVMQMYAYEASGQPTFYMATGTLQNNQITAQLGRYEGGRHLGSGPRSAAEVGSPGAVTLRFTSGITGFITLPGEAEVAISRFEFGQPRSPELAAGTWIYTRIGAGTDNVQLLSLTQAGAASNNGTGIMVDPAKNIGCEYLAEDLGPYNMLCGQITGSTVTWQSRIRVVGQEGEGVALHPTTGEPQGMVYIRRLIDGKGQQLGLFAPDAPQSSHPSPSPSPSPSPAPTMPIASYAGTYSVSGGGVGAVFVVDSTGNISRCTSVTLVACAGQVSEGGTFRLTGNDADGTAVTLVGTIDVHGNVSGSFSGSSDGEAVGGAFTGSRTGSSGTPATGPQALAVCWQNTAKTVWLCDGPTQKLLTGWTLREALTYAGCPSGSQISIGALALRQKSDNQPYTARVYSCQFALASYQRDMREYWNGLSSAW